MQKYMRGLAVGILLLVSSGAAAQNTISSVPSFASQNANITSATSVIVMTLTNAYSTLGVETTGTWQGTLRVTGSVGCVADSGYVPLNLMPKGAGEAVTSFTSNGTWVADISSLKCVKVSVVGPQWSGTATVYLRSGFSAGTAGGGTLNVALSQDGDDSNVKVVQSVLPAGAATEKTLAAIATGVGGGGLATEATLAAMSAKLVPGTAGSASASVTSVQGVASGVPVPVICTSGCSTSTAGAGPGPSGAQNLLYALDNYTTNLVPNGAAVFAIADKTGRQIQITGCNADDRVSSMTSIGTTPATVPVVGFSAIAGIRYEIYDIIAANTSPTPVIIYLTHAGGTLVVLPVPANFAGVVHSFTVPLTTSTNSTLSITTSTGVANLYVTVTGCKAR